MKDVIGVILLIIGAVGIATLLGMTIYSAFGWAGVALMLSVVLFLCGMVILSN